MTDVLICMFIVVCYIKCKMELYDIYCGGGYECKINEYLLAGAKRNNIFIVENVKNTEKGIR